MKMLVLPMFILSMFTYTAVWSQTGKQQTGMNMFIENESKYDFNRTIEDLKAEIEKKGWKLSATHDLAKTLKTHGKEVLPVQVFAVCHPNHAARILDNDDSRIVSVLMPCRISVYTKSNGKTYISRMNPSTIAISYAGTIGQVMTESAAEIEEIISNLIIKK